MRQTESFQSCLPLSHHCHVAAGWAAAGPAVAPPASSHPCDCTLVFLCISTGTFREFISGVNLVWTGCEPGVDLMWTWCGPGVDLPSHHTITTLRSEAVLSFFIQRLIRRKILSYFQVIEKKRFCLWGWSFHESFNVYWEVLRRQKWLIPNKTAMEHNPRTLFIRPSGAVAACWADTKSNVALFRVVSWEATLGLEETYSAACCKGKCSYTYIYTVYMGKKNPAVKQKSKDEFQLPKEPFFWTTYYNQFLKILFF